MAKGADELVHFLVDSVALRFAEGATIDQFKESVGEFYAKEHDTEQNSSAPVRTNLTAQTDQRLLTKAWVWLLRHPDIWVGIPAVDPKSPPEILVQGEQNASVLSLAAAEATDLQASETPSVRIWTSHERVWHSVAGHGVDYKRIPGEEFRLLCLILAAGPAGIAQPELVKLSKQDKKSVPGRTDNLSRNGYIKKVKVYAEKHNTSLLTHKRHWTQDDVQNLSSPVFLNGHLIFDGLLSLLQAKLQDGTQMKMDDLEIILDCTKKSWEKKSLWRALERLDILGIIQRFRVIVTREKGVRGAKILKTRYIRLIREPTDEDYRKYTNLSVKEREEFRQRLEAQDADTRGEHAEYSDNEADNTVHTTSNAMAASPDPVPSGSKTSAKLEWNPDTPWPSTLFKALDEAGAHGITSQAMRDRTYGRFYDRPMEQMLSRLTDAWQEAQPDHLKQFSIIRDTDTQGRATSYLYRSHNGFQQAVNLGDTIWDAATNGKPYKPKSPDLDELGFAKLNDKLFYKRGTASLGEAIRTVKIRREVTTKTDPTLGKRPDGSLMVEWNVKKSAVKSTNLPKRKYKTKRKIERVVSEEPDEVPNDVADAGHENDPESGVEMRHDLQNEAKANQEAIAEKIRAEAESAAYNETRQTQKRKDLPTSLGPQVIPSWTAGSGRPKLIIMDDTIQPDEAELTPFDAGKRPPILVKESRVQELIQEITAKQMQDAQAEASDEPQRDALLVKLISPRLHEFDWFICEDDSLDAPVASQQVTALAPLARTASEETKIEDRNESLVVAIAATSQLQSPIPVPLLPETDMTPQSKKRRAASIKRTRASAKKRKTEISTDEGVAAAIALPNILPEHNAGSEARVTGAELHVPSPDITTIEQEVIANQVDGQELEESAYTLTEVGQKVTEGRVSGEEREGLAVAAEVEQEGTAGHVVGDLPEEHAPGSTEIEFEVMEHSPSKQDASSRYWGQRSSNYDKPATVRSNRPRKTGIMVGRGTAMYKRTLIIEKILAKCGGVFPGDIEMVVAFQRTQREDPKSTVTSDRDTIMKTVKSMVDGGKLTRVTFYVDDDQGKKVQRWLLLQSGIEISSENAKAVMAKIQERYPARYNPLDEDESRPAPPQKKNIDRFRYIPKDSLVPPAGAEFIIDIEARRRELESQRLAAEAKKRAKQQSKLQAQAERNKKKQQQMAHKPRMQRAALNNQTRRRRAEGQGNEDDLGYILPSIEDQADGTNHYLTGHARHGGFRWISNQFGPDAATGALHVRKDGGNGMAGFLDPVQQYYPSIGVFSTDFSHPKYARNVQTQVAPTFLYEHHDMQNPDDIAWYKTIDEKFNSYHPDKGRRRRQKQFAKRILDIQSDDGGSGHHDPAWFENNELEIMKAEHPGLIHEPTEEGFANLTFGHSQEIAQEAYRYGVNPMEQVVVHGASMEDLRGINFDENVRRSPSPREVISLASDTDSDSDSEMELEQTLPPPPIEKLPHQPLAAKAQHKIQIDSLVELDTPATAPEPAVSRRAVFTQSGACSISAADARKLFFACIATRTLSGDLDGSIRWGPISQIFADHPNFDLPTFKARWVRMTHNFQETVDRVQREFQDAFLDAYEKGELPVLDLQYGTKLYYKDTNDWATLIDWAVKTIPVFASEVQLPATRKILDQRYEVKSVPTDVQDLRDRMEHAQATNSKRDEVIHGLNFSRPIVLENNSQESEDMEIARSWARAACAIPNDRFDAQATNAKLNNLDQVVLNTAMKTLHAEKVIAHSFKGRTKAARNYHLSAQYSEIFKRRPLDATDYAAALAFKSRLDDAFATSDQQVLMEYIQSDGAYMALTELLAAGRIHIQPVLPPVNNQVGDPFPRLTVWGFNEGQYKLRSMDKRTFLWDIAIMPTQDYIMGVPIEDRLVELLPPDMSNTRLAREQSMMNGVSQATSNGTHNKIPLWYDLHNNLLPEFWTALIRSVVQHFAIKAGSSIRTLTAPFKGLLWEWEIKLLMDWFVKTGVVQIRDCGARAKEWWWTVGPILGAHYGEDVGEAMTVKGGAFVGAVEDVGGNEKTKGKDERSTGVVDKIKAATRPAPTPRKKQRVRRSRKEMAAARAAANEVEE